MASVLTVVFCNPLCDVMEGGVALKHPTGRIHHLFIKLGLFLNDGQAHKLVMGVKGDGGCRFCTLCLNAWSSVSPVLDEDGEPLMICKMIKSSDMVPATDSDLLGAVDRLAHRFSTGAPKFKDWEKASGLNHMEHGMLQNQQLRSKGVLEPVTQYVHDPMHCLLANGVMNIVLWLLLAALMPFMNIWSILCSYVTHWNFPKHVKMDHLSDIFSEPRARSCLKAKKFKAMASELLSVYVILAFFFQSLLLQGSVQCEAEITAFLAFCDVMDMFQIIPLGLISPDMLKAAIETFLQACVQAGWADYMIPKFHWLLHMPGHLRKFFCIPTCFALERKHRLIKRFAATVRRTQVLMTSVYKNVLNHELSRLREPDVFKTGVFLKGKSAPSKKVLKYLSELVGVNLNKDEVFVSSVAHLQPAGWSTKGDIVLLKSDTRLQQWCAAQLWLHVELPGQPLMSLVSQYSLREYKTNLYAAIWDVQDNPMIVYTTDLLCSLVYKVSANVSQVTTLIPLQFR